MPEQLAHRDLRNRSSEILREVQNGAAYEITNHGEVVAILAPVTGHGRHDLRIRAARNRGDFSSLPRVERQGRTQEALDALRADR